jgi:hypothetical protein
MHTFEIRDLRAVSVSTAPLLECGLVLGAIEALSKNDPCFLMIGALATKPDLLPGAVNVKRSRIAPNGIKGRSVKGP